MITLREATIDDTGSYECKATNVAGTVTISTTIEIQQAPVITLDKETHDVTEGDELRIVCSAVGIPTPTVAIKVPDASGVRPAESTWGRSDRPEALLSHVNIRKNQGGLYECVAVNEAGQDLRYIQVNVKDKRGDVGK